MSRTAERSQGFHDLWPHTPKLNTRNAKSRNRKNQRCLTRGTQANELLGYQESSAEPRRTHSKAVLEGPREGVGRLAPTAQAGDTGYQYVRGGRSPRSPAQAGQQQETRSVVWYHPTPGLVGRAPSTLCWHPRHSVPSCSQGRIQ